MTRKQMLARRRNWTIFRLKGMQSLLAGDVGKLVRATLPKKDRYLLICAKVSIHDILKKMKESKYVEK